VVVGLPGVSGCTAVVDSAADLTAWTNSFDNIQCYDKLKVKAILNEINSRKHDGASSAPVPTLFGMNLHSVLFHQRNQPRCHCKCGGHRDAVHA
jgi:hypothetical protein